MIKRWKGLFCGILFVSLINHTCLSQCVSSSNSFYAGEKLNYQALYTWGFIWVHAADIQLTVSSQKIGSMPGYWIMAKASSLKAFDWFFKVRDCFQSLVTAEQLTPLWYSQNTSEGGFEVNETYSFDQRKGLIYHHATITHRQPIQDTVHIPSCTFDILSSTYYCRTIPFDNYKVNSLLTVNTLIDGKLYPIHIRFLGREIIHGLHSKEKFRCFKVEATAVESTNFKEGQKIYVWFTDDKNHLPVMIEAKVVVGSVRGYLDSYKGLRNPLESKIGSN